MKSNNHRGRRRGDILYQVYTYPSRSNVCFRWTSIYHKERKLYSSDQPMKRMCDMLLPCNLISFQAIPQTFCLLSCCNIHLRAHTHTHTRFVRIVTRRAQVWRRNVDMLLCTRLSWQYYIYTNISHTHTHTLTHSHPRSTTTFFRLSFSFVLFPHREKLSCRILRPLFSP